MSAAVHVPSGWGHFREWISPGPTIDRFIRSLHLSDEDLRDVRKRTQKKVRVLQGPIGSGKTTGILGGCAANAQRQPQQPINGERVRVYELHILRTDYRLLWSQFIDPFWFKWFPKESAWTDWQGATDAPAQQHIRLNTEFGKCLWKVQFLALSDLRTPEQISNFWRGKLPNDLWYEEMDGFSEDIYLGGFSRLGRGVEMRYGGPTCPTLFGGTNAPLIGSWMHRRIVSGRWKRDQQYFCQPSGDGPDAENLHNLPPSYYDDQATELDDRNYQRLVQNKFVMPKAGTAVHPEYRDSFHGAPGPLKPDRGLHLVISIDPKTRPSAAFSQHRPNGQWRVLNEVIGTNGMGSQRFAEMLLEMLRRDQYREWLQNKDAIRCVVDPSATYGADTDAGELDWLQRVEKITDIRIIPARSNKARNRRDALKAVLRRTVDDGQPSLLVSTECPNLRTALGGMFHYAEINLQGAGSGKGESVEPVKNEYADIAEALEYGVQEYGGLDDAGVPAGSRAKRRERDDLPDYAEG